MASPAKTKIKFLTYNVWSREHVAVYRRIHAISELIEQHDPDVIFLQVSLISYLLLISFFPIYSRLSVLDRVPRYSVHIYLCLLNVWLYHGSYRRRSQSISTPSSKRRPGGSSTRRSLPMTRNKADHVSTPRKCRTIQNTHAFW